MTPELAGTHLLELSEKSQMFYLRCEPEVPDFTIDQEFQLLISGNGTKIVIDVNSTNIRQLMGILDGLVFDNNKMVITWNIKPLFSYFLRYNPKPFQTNDIFLDLKVIENFLGFFNQKAPETLREAINRSKKVSESKSWNTIYKKLHLPLILNTLPRLETASVHHNGDRTSKFAYYEIEGQRNGRLRSFGKFNRSFLPHTMGEEQKKAITPKGIDDVFMLADINNCEVTLLQYLSGDSKIKEFLDNDQDVYVQIYELLTEDKCDSDQKRSVCKLIFLPIIYGCGARGLAENIGVNENTGRDLIKRVHFYFKEAIEWISSKEKEAKDNGVVEDYFGRSREFTAENFYTARNFVIQGPAATVCLEKLIELEAACRKIGSQLVFTVHDGYGITCSIKNSKQTFTTVKEVVETESKLCPGLFLGMHAQFGRKLNNLRTFWK